jgi:transposase
MRYSTSEKYEIIRLVESSSLSARQTLRWLNIHRSTFYNWLHRFQDNGIDGLEDRKPRPTMAWNQIPLEHRDAIIELALDKPELSPRELAVRYTDQQAYFISEYTVYRLLKALDLITNPAYILMQAGYSF